MKRISVTAIITGLIFGHFTSLLCAQNPVAPIEVLPAKVENSTLSQSKQFTVIGSTPEIRSAVAVTAEETKSNLLKLTGEKPDISSTPVTIELFGQEGDKSPPQSINKKLVLNELGYQIRINIHLGRGIDGAAFRVQLISALIYERALKKLPTNEVSPEGERLVVPPWLTEGLSEAMVWQQQQGDQKLYQALFKHGGLFKNDELFSTNEPNLDRMDGAMRSAFKVSSGALTMALLEQPQGKAGFIAFLNEIAAYQGETPHLLRKHFPELNLSDSSLAKWWALQLANRGTASTSDSLSINETENLLKEALHFHSMKENGEIERKPLNTWPELASLTPEKRLASLRRTVDSLKHLSYRCFPAYRPYIEEYAAILEFIQKNETKTVADQLKALDDSRAGSIARASLIRDYLDWFEITRARKTSGVFNDYLRVKDQLSTPRMKRNDHVSLYLDKLDPLFQRKK